LEKAHKCCASLSVLGDKPLFQSISFNSTGIGYRLFFKYLIAFSCQLIFWNFFSAKVHLYPQTPKSQNGTTDLFLRRFSVGIGHLP
jgi:hypothetical protein